MKNERLPFETKELKSVIAIEYAQCDVNDLHQRCHMIKNHDGILLSLWGSDERDQDGTFHLSIAFFVHPHGLLLLQTSVAEASLTYPDISDLFPAACRMQRALFDMLGIQPEVSNDKRRWLRHDAWPENYFPLRQDAKLTDEFENKLDHYDFIRISGEGVHEIPVGPVHAGIIEPGHFRFQIVGEQILRLEERLSYVHRGALKHFQKADIEKGAKLAGRICGDSTVAYAWSYAMAIEMCHEAILPERALWLRALALERERIANHLGDLGALGNDAGLSFALAQFSRLKETWLRTHANTFNHRYIKDYIIPGGVAHDCSSNHFETILDEIHQLEKEVINLRMIFDEHAGLQERLQRTGIVTPTLAKTLGVLGLPGRASAIFFDTRVDIQTTPYEKLEPNKFFAKEGDVAARVSLRFDEIFESLRLIQSIIKNCPSGDIQIQLGNKPKINNGFGCIEGWRGPILTALSLDNEKIKWAHMHDPSWQNWPALEHAVIGNIVPDFPLINKSFNLAYSGHDL